MEVLTVLIKWVHISSACILVGAAALMLWGVVPTSTGQAIHASLMKSFKMLVHSSLGLLLLTGIYNFWNVDQNNSILLSKPYQAVLGVKILLYVVAFALAILFFRKGTAAETGGVSAGGKTFLLCLVFLSLGILFLSAYLNVTRMGILAAH